MAVFCAGHGCRWKGGGEDESWSEGTDRVNHFRATGDVAAYTTICFAKSSSDNIHAIHDCATRTTLEMSFIIEMFCYTGSMWSVHAYSMDFIEKGDGAIFIGQVTNSFNWSNAATHAVHGFEGDNFRDVGWERG